MPEIHLRIRGFTYSACETFTKNNEVMQKIKEIINYFIIIIINWRKWTR